jgi:hypothetical protein
MARVVAPEAPVEEQVTESQEEQEAQEIPVTVSEHVIQEILDERLTEPLKVVRTQFVITVGRLINKNFNNARYEESVTFSLLGGTKEEKSEAYAKERDRIIKRVCVTAAAIAAQEQL